MASDATASPSAHAPHRPQLASLPLVGRGEDLAALTGALESGARGRGGAIFLSGEGGVGKTRLASAVAETAGQRGWTVVTGRAYPVESGVPYALFADAFLPLLRRLDEATLQAMTRGGAADLGALFPALALARQGRDVGARVDPGEAKARRMWTFAQFVVRSAAKAPLFVVLENLQWADASSLELLHFLARQVDGARVLLVCTYNDAEADGNAALRATEHSLVSIGAARARRLEPLSAAATAELIERVLGARGTAQALASSVHAWTRGNPFFVGETLKWLTDTGRLAEGAAWPPGGAAEGAMPPSIRDAVSDRLARLGADAREVATWVAVVGARVSHDALRAIARTSEQALLDALDELRRRRIIVEEAGSDGAIHYDFAHPIIRDTVYSGLGLARARALHAAVADGLERLYAADAVAHAGEIAAHLVRADAAGAAPKALRYVASAGREALRASANREAASYLQLALDLSDRGVQSDGAPSVADVVDDLARARQRLGEYAAAEQLWRRARDAGERAGEAGRVAAAERRMGLASYWSGRYDDALAHYDSGLEWARRGADSSLEARILVARGMCLQELGRPADARAEVGEALAIAERAGDESLLARAHRALLLLGVWTGPAAVARRHGEQALAFAAASSQPALAWSAHWAMAILGGLTGDGAATARHLAESERLAEALRSPVMELWTTEVAIEYASAVGEWERGLALADRAIPLARSLGLRTLLPRLLVWSGLIHLGRGDREHARAHFDEAWSLTRAALGDTRGATSPLDVHTVIPAHVGMAAYYLAAGARRHAIEVGEAGLAVARRSGNVAWAVHRLLPVVAEAALWMSDFDRARRYGAELRTASRQLDHRLGLAWADACDALVVSLTGDKSRAVGMLRGAADALDAVPFVLDGARLRRFLAQALSDAGDREGAMSELRRVHDVFAKLGAEGELALTREQMRELGARPPARTTGQGAEGLTAREVEICRLVAARKSNREIGDALGISPRTVSTHLSNVFGKLGVASRGELTDWVRGRESLGPGI